MAETSIKVRERAISVPLDEISDPPTNCPSWKAFCLCMHDPGHEGHHECECGGSWDQTGEVVRFPQRVVR